MLSKLFFHEDNNTESADVYQLSSALTQELYASYEKVHIEPCKPGGTLGLFFYADLDDERKFVKTHLPGTSYHDNLIKEINIMNALYGDIMPIRKVELNLNDEAYVFLVMDLLTVLKEKPDIGIIKEMISEYRHKLSYFLPQNDQIHTQYSFQQICNEAIKASEELAKHRFISLQVYDQCLDSIQRLTMLQKKDEKYTLCHGDLSNKNIMVKEDRFIVIDWEDAFWGIPDYDLYYWLTFFDQRQYYSLETLIINNIDVHECMACMAVVTLLKCFLSYRNGSYKNNSLSMEQRLKEIFKITNL